MKKILFLSLIFVLCVSSNVFGMASSNWLKSDYKKCIDKAGLDCGSVVGVGTADCLKPKINACACKYEKRSCNLTQDLEWFEANKSSWK
jgi:hypothetical protein